MQEKEELVMLEGRQAPFSPSPGKRLDQDDRSKEDVWNIATLPQGADNEVEIPKNKFLSKRVEALMMTALCTALFGELFLFRKADLGSTSLLRSCGMERRFKRTSNS